MDIYLNDWSCAGEGCLDQQFDRVKKFRSLVDTLSSTGFCRLIIDRKFTKLIFCDYPLAGVFPPYDETLSDDKRFYIQQLFKNFVQQRFDEGSPVATRDGEPASVLMAQAHLTGSHSLSLGFKTDYRTSLVKCKVNNRPAEVQNIWEPGNLTDLLLLLCSRKKCKDINPLEKPMWNTDVTQKYHDEIKAQLDMAKDSPELKRALLLQHATAIANINGWVLDEGLSKKNSSGKVKRKVFKPGAFKKKNAYLSIDFEKPEIRFEHHDRHGAHLGEIDWKGDPTDDPKADHNIAV